MGKYQELIKQPVFWIVIVCACVLLGLIITIIVMSVNEGYIEGVECSTASACSAACGDGSETRIIQCQDSSGKSVSESQCNSTNKPLCSQDCNLGACSCTYGDCDADTGELIQTCKDADGDSVDCGTYCPTKKPCGTWACSQWGSSSPISADNCA